MKTVEIVTIPLVWITDGLEAMIVRAAGDTEATPDGQQLLILDEYLREVAR